MYIPDQEFEDLETLEEMLIEFESAGLTDVTEPMVERLHEEMKGDKGFQDSLDKLDLDDQQDAYEEEFNKRYAFAFKADYKSFSVEDYKLYGINEMGRVLLMELHV